MKSVVIFLGMVCFFTIAQLNNVRFEPSSTFWAQISFAYIGMIFFCYIILTHKKIYIPYVVIPLSLFGFYLTIQPHITPMSFPGLNYITTIEMFICILIAITTNTIIYNYNLRIFTIYLSVAILIGVIIQSGIGFIQYANLFKYFHGIIFYDSSHPNTNIFGHFGQRNHYCHFLTWGVFALIYLFHQKIINKYFFAIIMFWLMFSITIASSRSVFLYFGCANIITLFYWVLYKRQDLLKIFLLTIIATLTLFAFEYLYPIITEHLNHNTQILSGFSRLQHSESGGEFGRRLVEWKKAIVVFLSNTVTGCGWYGYAHYSVFLYKLFPNAPLNDGLFTNCHNLILQLLAETGIIGTLMVCVGILYIIYKMLRMSVCANAVEIIIILCMIATTLIHSMVEYPLWYLYFLGVFVIFLSITTPIKTMNNKIITIAFMPFITLLFYIMITKSIIFDKLVNYIDTPDKASIFKINTQNLLDIANKDQLMSYFAIFTLDNYIEPDGEFSLQSLSLGEMLEYENKFVLFQPYPLNLTKLAKIEWNMGNKNTAIMLAHTAKNAYPNYLNSIQVSLHKRKYKFLYNLK